MNSVPEQVLSQTILSLSTFDPYVFSKLDLLAAKLERIACREQTYVVRDGLSQYSPLRKYLTDQPEVLSCVELVEEDPEFLIVIHFVSNLDALINLFEDHFSCDTSMYVENNQLIIENVLRKELNEGCLAASSFSHYDHGDSGLHSEINDAHFEEIVCGNNIFVIHNLQYVVMSAEHLKETLELIICHFREVWYLYQVLSDKLSNLVSLFFFLSALINKDEQLNVFGDFHRVLVHEDQTPVLYHYLCEVIRRLPGQCHLELVV
jgi:hypothetical protein